MKKFLPLFILPLLVISCSSVKKTQQAINFGNYDLAINTAVKNLRINKTKKSNQSYVLMLEEAFSKAVARDNDKIKFLKEDNNPAKIEAIFNLYLGLKNRQEVIKPLLPLPILKKGKNAKFHFEDYTSDILTYKDKLSLYLYNKAENQLNNSRNKLDFRAVFDDLKYIDQINPNFKNTKSLLEEAHFKGT